MLLRPRGPALTLLLLLLLITITLLLWWFRIDETVEQAIARPPPIGNDVLQLPVGKNGAQALAPATADHGLQELNWLQELADSPDIRFPLHYARRDIIVREDLSISRASITKVGETLLPKFQKLDNIESARLSQKNRLPPLLLNVPSIRRNIDASHIIFGAATTLQRLEASIPYFERWLPNTGARLIVVAKGEEDADPDHVAMSDLETRMRQMGMLVTIVQPLSKEDGFIERYFSLIKILSKHRDDKTRWFGFIDDDTFITSMSTLVSRLRGYNHKERWYLGAVSEEWWTVCQYGWIAMGGGGIFVSSSLMDVLDANYAQCTQNAMRTFGDHRIYECITQTTETRLTQFDGLYQIDVHGDRSGIFESGREIISQHHWKEGYWSEDGSGPDAIRHPRWFPMDTMALVADVCGDTCFLQRWQFGKDTVLTNGYSIAVYPGGRLSHLEWFKMERTWVTQRTIEGSLTSGWDHYLGPLRPALKLDEEKIHYRFMDAKRTENGVRQYFRHLGKDGELDTLIELNWQLEDSGEELNSSVSSV